MKILSALFLVSMVSGLAADVVRKPTLLPDFSKLLGEADSLVVYEGLPHPVAERDAWEEEKILKKNFAVAETYFYEKILPVVNEDRKALDHAFMEVPLCAPLKDEKAEGQFYGEYMIEWKSKGDGILFALLCFSCNEMLFVKDTWSQRTEITKEGRELIIPILSKYRQERPASKSEVAGFPSAGDGSKPQAIPAPKMDKPSIDVPKFKMDIKR